MHISNKNYDRGKNLRTDIGSMHFSYVLDTILSLRCVLITFNSIYDIYL